MNSSLPDGSPVPVDGPAAAARERVRLAREWAYVVTTTSYIPLSQEEIEQELLTQVTRLFAAVAGEPVDREVAVAVGRWMVELGCVGQSTLQSTVDVLGKSLLRQPDLLLLESLAERVVVLLGAMASGYADALRLLVQEQQENLNRALLKSVREAKRELKTSETRFEEVFTRSASGMAITDLRGGFLRVNRALAEILERPEPELAELSLFDVLAEEDVPVLREAFGDMLAGNGDWLRLWRRLARRDGELVRASLSLSLMRDDHGRPSHCVTIIQDDSELSLLQGQLRHQSLHDVLTGLPNRQYFTTRLEGVLPRTDPATGVTLYHLDLDAFSLVTNGLGRRVGDCLLVTVAERLKDVFAGERAMIARFDADRFAVLVENSPTTPDVLSTVARINEEFAEPIYVDGHGIAASAGIGVVHRPPADMDANDLLQAADLTLRRVKSSGRGQWGLRDPDREAEDRRAYALAATVPGAWEVGELTAVYRPLVRLSDKPATPVGVEARLRWGHPELGVLRHERCARLVEDIGQALRVGRWLLRTACESVHSGLMLAVDLTVDQARDPDLVGQVREALAGTGVPPARLRLGFPVPTLLAEHDEAHSEAADNLKLLVEAGVEVIATGFGSVARDLPCLEELPVRAVRVARSLVQRLARAGEASLTARALTDLVEVVHLAGAAVEVDGVETEEQADWWRRVGAETASGPLFAGCAAEVVELPWED